LLFSLKETICKSLRDKDIPDGLSRWLQNIVTVSPIRCNKVSSSLDNPGILKAPLLLTRILDTSACVGSTDWLIGSLVAGRRITSPLSVKRREALCKRVCRAIDNRWCNCDHLIGVYPALSNSTNHLFIRDPQQWEHVVSNRHADLVSSHARTVTLPDPEFVASKIGSLRETLYQCLVPVAPDIGPDQILDNSAIETLCNAMLEQCNSSLHSCLGRVPFLGAECVNSTRLALRDLGVYANVFDKNTSRMAGLCVHTMDTYVATSVLLGSRFEIVGWGRSRRHAQSIVLSTLAISLDSHGIMDDMNKHNKGYAQWQSLSKAQAYILSHLQDPDRKPCRYKAPEVSSIVKWKSNVVGPAPPSLKFRDIISFARHPVRPWARLISRVTQLMVSFLYNDMDNVLGKPTLVGVRDLLSTVASSLTPDWHTTLLREMDMADMFWELPTGEVIRAMRWALTRIRSVRRCRVANFALSVDGDKAGACPASVAGCRGQPGLRGSVQRPARPPRRRAEACPASVAARRGLPSLRGGA
jgi:hypothetical protein